MGQAPVAPDNPRRSKHHDGVADLFAPQSNKRVQIFGKDAHRPRGDAFHEESIAIGGLLRRLITTSHESSSGKLDEPSFYVVREGQSNVSGSAGVQSSKLVTGPKAPVGRRHNMKAMARGHRLTPLVAMVAGFALLVGTYAWAQSGSGPIAPKAGQAVQKAPQAPAQKPLDQSSIRVRVDLVNAPVVVRDSKGELVLDLTQNDFHIFDNGVEQKLEGFDIGGAPLSVVIVMETSSRIDALLPAIRKTGVLFTETVVGESGDAAVIGYDDQVNHLQDFTADHDAIEKTINNLKSG